MLAPILEKVAEEMKDKVILLKANLDEAPKTAEKFKVEKIPTVILFKNGQPISGFVGLAPEKAIREWIEESSKTSAGPDINEIIGRYDNYAKSNGFRLNPDRKTVERIIKGLLMNEQKFGKRYCPCRRVTGNEAEDANKICPCAFHKEEIEKDGHCFCNLFVKN
jgi:ferredoxin-thioredoxin reductase catalytic subunit